MNLLCSASRVLVSGLALGFALLPISLLAAGDDPIVGRWSGQVTEQSGDENTKYPVTIQFDSPSHGSSEYSTYKCNGELTGGPAANSAYSYTEKIKNGSCTDGGHYEVKLVNHDTISILWSHPAENTVSGTLTRQ